MGNTPSGPPATLDFSKAQPLSAPGVTLDFSKAQPLDSEAGPSGVTGVLSGIGGGVIGTAAGAEKLLNKALPSSMQIPAIPPEYYQQKTGAEKAGGFLEGIGEFVLGDEALKGLDVAGRLGLAQKVAHIAQSSPKVARALELGMNAIRASAVGGAQGGIEASAQDKPVLQGAAGGAIGAGLGSAGGEAVGGLIGKVGERLEEGAPKIGNALLQANKVKNFLYGKNPGRVFVDEDIPLKGWTNYKDIEEALGEANSRIYGEARNLLSMSPAANNAIHVVPGMDAIVDMAETNVQNRSGWANRKAVLNGLSELRDEITQNFDRDGNAIGPKGPMTPAQITKLKTDLGRGTKWDTTVNPEQQMFLNNVRKQVYSFLDSVVDQAVPEMKPLNDRWANLIEAEGLIKRRVAQEAATGFGQSALRSKAIISAGLLMMRQGLSPEGALLILNEAARTPTGRMLRMKAGPPVGRALQAAAPAAGELARATGAEAGAQAGEDENE